MQIVLYLNVGPKGFLEKFECSLLIINEEQLHRENNTDNPMEINKSAYWWDIPENNIPHVNHHGVIFSEEYKSLLCIGGQDTLGNITKSTWKLSFDQDAYWKQKMDKWQWVKMPDLNVARASSSVCLINYGQINQEYVCVLGG